MSGPPADDASHGRRKQDRAGGRGKQDQARGRGRPDQASGRRREPGRTGRGAGVTAGEEQPTFRRGPVRRAGDHDPAPPLPDEVTGTELDREVRAELRPLSRANADDVARHLVMAGRLLDEDPETAYRHALAARRRAGRVAAVREAAGLAAYATGRYAEALGELRAARRISGSSGQLPVMADCERGLGRPERALQMASSDEVRQLDPASRAEMRIVAAGARRDLGQLEAAVVTLQGPELGSRSRRPWMARLRYAYADALLAVGREDEALEWFRRAADDDEGGTDAGERLAELEGVTFLDPPDPSDPPS